MKDVRIKFIENGDMCISFYIFRCECCDEVVLESDDFETTDEGVYCLDCAFKKGIISEAEYIKRGVQMPNVERAVVHDGEIYLGDNKYKFPWERTKRQQRNSPQYIEWRRAVFARDGYKCAICGQVGGTLNAHHIKPFAKYPDLRLELDNGITLCEKCHREVHRKKGTK